MKTRNKVLVVIGIVALIALVGFYVFLESLSPGGVFGYIEPLRFSIFNWDENKHDITVEIFDSTNKTIFSENYSIEPGRAVSATEITEERGEYMFKVTLDNNITKMHKAYVEEGKGGVHITIKPHSHIDISNVVAD
ncbi:MAG: hypothetical protein QMD22_05115 [archaeon]|nr:hypothetical protein [archaeon]